jgi:hypothetical protein
MIFAWVGRLIAPRATIRRVSEEVLGGCSGAGPR